MTDGCSLERFRCPLRTWSWYQKRGFYLHRIDASWELVPLNFGQDLGLLFRRRWIILGATSLWSVEVSWYFGFLFSRHFYLALWASRGDLSPHLISSGIRLWLFFVSIGFKQAGSLLGWHHLLFFLRESKKHRRSKIAFSEPFDGASVFKVVHFLFSNRYVRRGR